MSRLRLILPAALLMIASTAHAQSRGMVLMTGEATRVERAGDKVTYWFADGSSWTTWPGNAVSGKITFHDANGGVLLNPDGGADPTRFELLEEGGGFYVSGSLNGFPVAYVKIETDYNTHFAPLGYTLGGLDPMGPGQWWFEMWW